MYFENIVHFYACLKNGTCYGNICGGRAGERAVGRAASTGFALSK